MHHGLTNTVITECLNLGEDVPSLGARQFELFYSRFHSRFAPESRSTSISLHQTLSLSTLIALFKRGLFDEGDG